MEIITTEGKTRDGKLKNTLRIRVKTVAAQQYDTIRAVRRHLHANPELSFKERDTADFLVQTLTKHGLKVRTVADTGLVVEIAGKDPKSRTVALRADMDALPIQEQNEVPYRSKQPGVMHACGHDAHMAMLVGVALVLHHMRDAFTGTVRLLFQPAEETCPGGALNMIQAGVLDDPTPVAIIGQHVYPGLPAGMLACWPGPVMGSADELRLSLTGHGGHAAMPHKATDLVTIAAQLIIALQQTINRHCNPNIPTVLSLGSINSHQTATNVLPDQLDIAGTFRTLDETWRAQAHTLLTQTATGLVQSLGGNCQIAIRKGYPSVRNHETLTQQVRQALSTFVGDTHLTALQPMLTAEDFAYYGQHIPACFYLLGVGNEEKGITSGLHTPTFDIDEWSLELGMSAMAWTALHILQGFKAPSSTSAQT